MPVAGDLEGRERYIVNRCHLDGAVTVDPVSPSDPEPEISVRVKAPGGTAGHDASFRYFEAYRRTGSGFELIEYAYGFWSQRALGSLEYHWHPLPWSARQSVFHVHCQPGPQPRGHFRAHAMTFDEARAQFRLVWASADPIDCSGLYRM